MSSDAPCDAQFALDFNPDVSVERIAAVYADALAGAADAKGVALDGLVDEFNSFVTDILGTQKVFDGMLASAMVSVDDKIGVLQRTLGTQASPLFLQFLKVVAGHGRLDIVRDILRQVRKIVSLRRGEVDVIVTTATAIDASQVASIVERLAPIVGGTPILKCHVDPHLIGGLVVRVGDLVYDASLFTQLKTVRQQMIDRSTNEIQSRRNSFCYPEGN
ncbi:MAG: ATP synthase F1 subunit delta [Thermoguttaceae bacterium]